MPSFGKRSLTALATCDPRLVAVAKDAIQTFDFTVLEGHRGQAAQEAAVAAGLSKCHWPQSMHNADPSRAFDLAPYPIDWEDIPRFVALADHILVVAERLGIALRWGGLFWGGTHEHPTDAGHFEVA